MRIAFVLPRDKNEIIGGFKVVYEYANRLAYRGHEISIIYNNENTLEKVKMPSSFKRMAINLRTHIYPTWFALDPTIKKESYFGNGFIDEPFDAVFATSVGSVRATLKAFSGANLFYLIQDYENWDVGNDYVISTYNMGFHNIVVSEWLKKIVEDATGKEPYLLSNPIDLETYKLYKSIGDREPHSVGLLYHNSQHKGLKYSFEALYTLKELYPDLHVEMFGSPKRPQNLPDWFHYSQKASTEKTVEIYNKIAVFMCSSIDEGFGLTGMEAIACGAALASTDYTGVHEYAKDEFNALLCQVKDVEAMVNNVKRLMDNVELRNSFYNNSQTILCERTWDKSVSQLEKIICSTL